MWGFKTRSDNSLGFLLLIGRTEAETAKNFSGSRWRLVGFDRLQVSIYERQLLMQILIILELTANKTKKQKRRCELRALTRWFKWKRNQINYLELSFSLSSRSLLSSSFRLMSHSSTLSMASVSSPLTSCSTWRMRMWEDILSWALEIILSRVVLPMPLRPIRQ